MQAKNTICQNISCNSKARQRCLLKDPIGMIIFFMGLIMFIDSHAHLTSDEVFPQIDSILIRAKENGIDSIINICTDESTLNRGIELKKKYPWIYNTAATTPHDAEKEGVVFLPKVAEAAYKKDLVALGETGLDYYYEHSNRAMQQKTLSAYFELAQSCNLPIIFHCRSAFEDLFAMADEQYKSCKALLHCFTGSLAEAKGVLDRGWSISFSGIITFKKSDALREIVTYVPLDRIFIETDTPYLAPQSKRGSVNEPSFIIETAEVLASLKRVSVEEIGKQTSLNAVKFFSF